MKYTIGEVAKMTGLPTSTLRYYERLGLLGPLARVHGNRVFTERDVGQLHLIDCLKKSGLSIAQIQQFCALARQGDETLQERLELFRGRRSAVKHQIEALQRVLDILDLKCWYYEQACQDGSEEPVSCRSADELPDQYRSAATWLEWDAVRQQK